MSRKLDDELAAAIGPANAETDAPGLEKPVAPAGFPPPARPRSLGLLLTLLALVASVVALFLVGFKEAAIYATPVDKLINNSAAMIGRKVRVEGELVPGTLQKRDSPCEYRFTVHTNQAQMPVRYAQCVIPDTFRDVPGGGVQVTVEGALTAGGDFEATLVMAKCASKYDPSKHEMKPEGPAASN